MGVSFCINTDWYDCADASFCGPHHRHIIAGDLWTDKSKKSRKLSTKGLKYIESQRINFHKVLIEITTALDTCFKAMIRKAKYTT